jgi:hypothetical protein
MVDHDQSVGCRRFATAALTALGQVQQAINPGRLGGVALSGFSEPALVSATPTAPAVIIPHAIYPP